MRNLTSAGSGLVFKRAQEEHEFEQIHALNHRTFCEEIPQHAPNDARRRVDPHHEENDYLIALQDGRLVGMLALRDSRPFSLDRKLEDLDRWLPAHRRSCEIRLLAVEPSARRARVLPGLLRELDRHCRRHGHDLALISAFVDELPFYEKLGFRAFGPRVGAADARFQPMYLERRSFERARRRYASLEARAPVLLTPGPVEIADRVRAAWAERPRSHRSPGFRALYEEACASLRALTGAGWAHVLPGSGTFANDVGAAQLRQLAGKGRIISNGEFGERLVRHARGAGLEHEHVRLGWGEAIEVGAAARGFDGTSAPAWLWLVHCETSTGAVQDIRELARVCGDQGIRLCVDATSTLGAIPVDLTGVFLATSVSGKLVGSYPGLALILAQDAPERGSDRIPPALDLGDHLERGGVPFTLGSNQLGALVAALEGVRAKDFEAIARCAQRARARLESGPCTVLPSGLPCLLTVALPRSASSRAFGERARRLGFQIGFESSYLLRDNRVQLCFHRPLEDAVLEPLLQCFDDVETAGSPPASEVAS